MNPSANLRGFHRAALTASLLAASVLAGCASPDFLRVGMTRAELDARFGAPSAERRDGSDDIRVYVSAPLGQRASAVHIGPDGRVNAVEPLLNLPHFATIRAGEWNRADVFSHFGKPAEVSATRQFPLVWSYRYRESEQWDSLFAVMFDSAGIVRATQNGPDPMYDHGREGRF